MKKYFLIILTIMLFLIPTKVHANEKVNIYIFHNETCIHCKHAISYLNELKEKDSSINIYTYEISKITNAHNRNLLNKAEKVFDINILNVPFVIIGNTYYIGFNDNIKNDYDKTISFYKNNDYKDIIGIEFGIINDDENNNNTIKDYEKEYSINIPLIGKINLQKLSLPIISIVMGFVDGFNPCAMWILLFLITILFSMKDKKKMWILGSTFILSSALIYFFFMMAWLKVTSFINSISILRIIISIFAIIFGSINLYRYYKERKQSGCTIVNKKERKLITENIKNIVKNKSFIISIIGIIALSIVVNLVELLCSLGLPVMFTEILSLNNLSNSNYLIYIIIYIIFFMLDDIIIFIISMMSLKSAAISTKYNKYSHLIGGIIMILIGILILLKPDWLAFSFN